MTDKQKEAIEEFEKLIKLRKNKAGEIKFDTCIVSTAQLEIVVNLIQTQQVEIEKKDKIIDLMAYDIATNDSDLCQYIDETIRCKKYAGENKLTCDECIKQYFERKVENGN